jgi:hypothetical protein
MAYGIWHIHFIFPGIFVASPDSWQIYFFTNAKVIATIFDFVGPAKKILS